MNPDASKYYSLWFAYDKFNGTTPTLAGIWNDMNEPSVYNNSNENTFPFELVHKLDDNGTFITHRDVHNIYGLMHVSAALIFQLLTWCLWILTISYYLPKSVKNICLTVFLIIYKGTV